MKFQLDKKSRRKGVQQMGLHLIPSKQFKDTESVGFRSCLIQQPFFIPTIASNTSHTAYRLVVYVGSRTHLDPFAFSSPFLIQPHSVSVFQPIRRFLFPKPTLKILHLTDLYPENYQHQVSSLLAYLEKLKPPGIDVPTWVPGMPLLLSYRIGSNLCPFDPYLDTSRRDPTIQLVQTDSLGSILEQTDPENISICSNILFQNYFQKHFGNFGVSFLSCRLSTSDFPESGQFSVLLDSTSAVKSGYYLVRFKHSLVQHLEGQASSFAKNFLSLNSKHFYCPDPFNYSEFFADDQYHHNGTNGVYIFPHQPDDFERLDLLYNTPKSNIHQPVLEPWPEFQSPNKHTFFRPSDNQVSFQKPCNITILFNAVGFSSVRLDYTNLNICIVPAGKYHPSLTIWSAKDLLPDRVQGHSNYEVIHNFSGAVKFVIGSEIPQGKFFLLGLFNGCHSFRTCTFEVVDPPSQVSTTPTANPPEVTNSITSTESSSSSGVQISGNVTIGPGVGVADSPQPPTLPPPFNSMVQPLPNFATSEKILAINSLPITHRSQLFSQICQEISQFGQNRIALYTVLMMTQKIQTQTFLQLQTEVTTWMQSQITTLSSSIVWTG